MGPVASILVAMGSELDKSQGQILLNFVKVKSLLNYFELTVGKMLGQVKQFLQKINREELNYDPEATIEDLPIENKVKVLMQDMNLIKWRQALEDN